MPEIIYKDESFKIVGACMEVYNEMGHGFLEAVYQECLRFELEHREIPFTAQHQLELNYKQQILRSTYTPDFVCFEKIILELKGTASLNDMHRAQTINYLKATGFKLGLLVNFGHPEKLQYERIVL